MEHPREYTTRIHAARLLAMLRQGSISIKCPAAYRFFYEDMPNEGNWSNDPCKVCADFISCHTRRGIRCPCLVLGEEEAVERSKEALNNLYGRKVI
jgi:hypothetical protein